MAAHPVSKVRCMDTSKDGSRCNVIAKNIVGKMAICHVHLKKYPDSVRLDPSAMPDWLIEQCRKDKEERDRKEEEKRKQDEITRRWEAEMRAEEKERRRQKSRRLLKEFGDSIKKKFVIPDGPCTIVYTLERIGHDGYVCTDSELEYDISSSQCYMPHFDTLEFLRHIDLNINDSLKCYKGSKLLFKDPSRKTCGDLTCEGNLYYGSDVSLNSASSDPDHECFHCTQLLSIKSVGSVEDPQSSDETKVSERPRN
jgi:hypothetical protein